MLVSSPRSGSRSKTSNAAGSAPGTINTAGSPLNVRTGASSSWSAWRTVADGASVTILCQELGSQETGTYGTSMFPETYLIDRQGRIARKIIGSQHWDEGDIAMYVQSLLAQN